MARRADEGKENGESLKPMLAITLGDPYSVNIEILLKSLTELKKLILHPRQPMQVIVIGSWPLFKRQATAILGMSWEVGLEFEIQNSLREGQHRPGLFFFDVDTPSRLTACPEASASTWSTKDRGELAVRQLSALVELCRFSDSGNRQLSVITLPIDKHACREAGFDFPGHTEFFGHAFQCKTTMLLAGPKLKVALVTNHVALRRVATELSQQLIIDKLSDLFLGLRSFYQIANPRIAVLGLNPHASDGGMFGDEEQKFIVPAIETFVDVIPDLLGRPMDPALGATSVVGPLAADTAFYLAQNGTYDGVLAMYHDQGLGPFKTLHFDEGINMTLGLPLLRVSPDHGPARDLFLKGVAKNASFRHCLQAIETNLGLVRR